MLVFDLDGFKSVNDTWGHAAGDAVLGLAAERLRRSMRASDTAGRLGGDEFLALLPEASEQGAMGVAEKARAALEAPYALGSRIARLSSSVGLAFFPRDGEDPDALQKAADAALYEAKRGGKNRVVMARAPRAAEAEAAPS